MPEAKKNNNDSKIAWEASEYQEAVALMEWAFYHPKIYEYLFHIPNGEYRPRAVAQKLKKAGVKAGISDYFLAIPSPPYSGLWIELKRATKGKVNLKQVLWLDKMNAIGYKAVTCNGATKAIEAIRDYLAGNITF